MYWTGKTLTLGFFMGVFLMGGCQCDRLVPLVTPEPSNGREFEKAAFEPSRLSLGEWTVGTKKPFSARLHNKGTSIINVIAIEPNCGCAEVNLNKKMLLPGETADLNGIFDARTMPGELRKVVIVKLKGVREGLLRLELFGTVHRRIRLSSDVLVLVPDFFLAAPGHQSLTVHNTSDKSVSLRIGELPKGLSGEINKPTLRSDEKTEILFSADSGFLADLQGEFHLYSTDSLENTIPLKYFICPKGALSYSPKAIRLGVLSKKDLVPTKEFKILIRGPALNEAAINDIKVPTHLQLLEKSLPGESAIVMRFALVVPPATSLLDGEIEVQFVWKGRKFAGVLRIPISGLILDAHS